MSLVTVITPTWGQERYGVLLGRCLPSVRMQSIENWDHVVVSDGPDPVLRQQLGDVRYFELPRHYEPHSWGASARNHGLLQARTKYVAYLDSDNAYRNRHLELLVAELERSGADFAYSRMRVAQTGQEIGADPPELGQIDSSLIVHKRSSIRRFGMWPVAPIYAIDWEFISGWIEQGATWSFVPEVTVDYYLKTA